MKASGRNWLITLQRAVTTQGASGAEVKTWATLADVWAEKLDVSDDEGVAAGEVAASITARFRLLWSEAYADVNPKDRLAYGARIYDIRGAKEMGFREGIEVIAVARRD